MNKLTSFILLLAAVTIHAYPTKGLTITTIDGQKQSIALHDYPVITMNGGNLVVKTKAAEFNFDLQKVDHFIYEDIEDSGIIPVADDRGTFSQDGDMLYFKAGNTDMPVAITSVGGIVMLRGKIPSGSTQATSIKDYPSGVYLVSTGTVTYKIIKQ